MLIVIYIRHEIIHFLCLWLRQPLWVILCRLPEKGRKEIGEIAENIKERDKEEKGKGMKVKKQKKWKEMKTFSLYPYLLQG